MGRSDDSDRRRVWPCDQWRKVCLPYVKLEKPPFLIRIYGDRDEHPVGINEFPLRYFLPKGAQRTIDVRRNEDQTAHAPILHFFDEKLI